MTDTHRAHACMVLSTHLHRFCERRDCTCPCHVMMAQVNYEKNDARRVKRIG